MLFSASLGSPGVWPMALDTAIPPATQIPEKPLVNLANLQNCATALTISLATH
jgi:hypothetical protein